MRRQTPIAHLLYNYLFPRPTPNDPPSFAAHLARNLVPEVRIEVSTFYGDLNSVEARYPGLNYCYPPHRMRLGRFKHHRRLFDAFDNLGLTYNEIQDFCCWEGTKWARERYEKDEGIYVLDTTGDDIAPFIDRRDRRVQDEQRRKITRQTQIEVLVEEARDGPVVLSHNNNNNNNSLSLHPRHHHHYHQDHSVPDAEMSDSDSLASEDADSDADSDTTLPSPHHHHHFHHQVIATALPPSSLRPHNIPMPTSIPSQILTAWEQGHQLPPELEQFLKDHASGEAGDDNGLSTAAGFVDPRPLLSSATAAAAAAVAGRVVGRERSSGDVTAAAGRGAAAA
ncbi:hypothetical protein KC332_g9429 [Hortaea werneckii]|uniref:Uncharacterized protein n=2 Tax=Hortaea werneckii TaxID=91943 RepID=A0A3M7HZR9_HORWE|nr:hypothetical protein KC358_g9184 [Hortaea werneckii]OTA23624.1 hypothetical protein BTJ68_13967 [Hortaea werneckii EXF-2000]KAI6848701.1 hypothetical protein KC350_g2909 [Hortaea werneckii]KAI6923285.1 hypothetical protein KC348_g9561 [Hortaea werneckii]KAI6932425.1 hypothetical protein KC341_g8974 [Hortaea werneckii]